MGRQLHFAIQSGFLKTQSKSNHSSKNVSTIPKKVQQYGEILLFDNKNYAILFHEHSPHLLLFLYL